MARQSTLNVSLTATLDRYVRGKVSNGEYESASEVVRDGLRALREREATASAFWADVRKKVAAGKRDLAAGRVVDGETAMNEIIAGLNEATVSKSTRKLPSRKRTSKR